MNSNDPITVAAEIRLQWSNPSDILSLLLLIGGDIVQKAIAQLVGYSISIWSSKPAVRVPIVPVAFSFGWVAYGFSNLLSAFGDKKLMPAADCPSLVINCSNGFVRQNQSWILGRILRDHQSKHKVDPRDKAQGGREESMRIDIFDLKPVSDCDLDLIWWSGWITIAAQFGIAIPPWYLYGDWGTMLIALSGNALVAITCALPQWFNEKWAGRLLGSENVTCLTSGNGYLHIMVFLGREGCWNFESMATGIPNPRPETRFVSLVLAILWTCLLISVSGLKNNAWFLVGIGSLGMLQNVFAAGAARTSGSFNVHLATSSRVSTIVGRRNPPDKYTDKDAERDDETLKKEAIEDLLNVRQWVAQGSANATLPPPPVQMPQWLNTMSGNDGAPEWLSATTPPQDATTGKVVYAIGVHGALIELEKWVPTAGLAMVQLFFPAGLEYADQSIRDNIHKKFWKRAYHTKDVRSKADKKRRVEENKRREEDKENV